MAVECLPSSILLRILYRGLETVSETQEGLKYNF